jgi:hypothetical protein
MAARHDAAMADEVRVASETARAGPPQTSTMSSFGLTWRLVVTGLIVAALGYGTLVGTDDDWPFGPMRQYANATPVSSDVLVTHVSGVDRAGHVIRLDTQTLGLRVAELDGQLDRLRRHPELLLSLATAYRQAHPQQLPLVRLLLERDGNRIRDRKVVAQIHRVVAEVRVP